MNKYIHACMNACVYIYTVMHACIYMHARIRAHTYIQMHECMHVYVHAYTYTQMHECIVYTYMHECMHIHTHVAACINTHGCMHACMCIAPSPFLRKWCCARQLFFKEEAKLCLEQEGCWWQPSAQLLLFPADKLSSASNVHTAA